jgi:delta 1-pyrroline-5-carboxylate dehydrogenase
MHASEYSTEIFGPVLTVLHAESLDEAIALINRNKCQYPFKHITKIDTDCEHSRPCVPRW